MSNNEVQVINNNGELVVSSRQVAFNFVKAHKNILRSIEDIKGQLNSEPAHQMFFKSEYVHPQNGLTYTEYLMNRDGFSLLVMGFTGKEALQWKLKYIEAFNAMEKQLKSLSPSYMIEDPIERAKAWIKEQEEKKALQEQAKLNAPKVEAYNNIVDNSVGVGLREMAKIIGYPINKMGAYCVELGLLTRDRISKYTYYPTSMAIKNKYAVTRWVKASYYSKAQCKTVFLPDGVEYVRQMYLASQK